ncbi:hypothetical protein K440DRAFT_600059 [Wilcoxina mikolae CBS 423.85]|nr:hypothetical protein K440DRAFT_600059 [Wilcoxina mikolae CBS 423.85]
MVLDYSKWDKIELSDDSDIEVHPNVDKRSFINAKRRQIHEQRHLRKQQIGLYKNEVLMNEYLLKLLNKFTSSLVEHSCEPAEDLVMKTLIQLSADDHSHAPQPPPGTPSYVQMMASLVDVINQEIDDEKPNDRWKALINKLQEHRDKLAQQTMDTSKRLGTLEKEEHSKITSDDVYEGFSAGHINKSQDLKLTSKKKDITSDVTQDSKQLKYPTAISPQHDRSMLSASSADVEDVGGDSDESVEHIEPSELGREFAQISIGGYRQCFQFISEHPVVVSEKETDGLLIDAFNSQLAGREVYAKQCVHQALLLQYCRQLGRDGVSLFFKRITTPGHQAQKVFHDDVEQTYSRIRERAKEITTERSMASQGVEQIQLHALDPNTTINISIPPPNSVDPEVEAARQIFESFPPALRRALECRRLEEVNVVLGKLSVEAAEEIVGLLGKAGMLSLDSQIIDATTEEGKKVLHQIEEQQQLEKRVMKGL